MIRLSGLVPLLMLLASSVQAETVRVAVARGPSLRVEGKSLLIRSSAAEKGTRVEGPIVLEMVGPLVSTGDQMEPSLFIEDSAGTLVINGVPLAGKAQVTTEKGGLLAIDVVELEQYVAAVVSSEMPADWPAAALQAQAIATRTYVLKKKSDAHPDALYDVESTVISQVYRGRAGIEPSALAAARETQGRVLAFGGHLAEAFFFASCAGTTETASNAFGHSQPYLKPVSCELPTDSISWTRQLPLSTASKLFQARGLIKGELKDLQVEARTTTSRVATVRLVGQGERRVITGVDLRKELGYQTLPSLDFRVEKSGSALAFKGRGAGHGVGLCQWCARALAAKGKTVRDILQHFYPGTSIQPLSAALLAAAKP